MDVICESCGYVYKGHHNMYGKICMNCGSYIPAVGEIPIVKETKAIKQQWLYRLRELLRSRIAKKVEPPL